MQISGHIDIFEFFLQLDSGAMNYTEVKQITAIHQYAVNKQGQKYWTILVKVKFHSFSFATEREMKI